MNTIQVPLQGHVEVERKVQLLYRHPKQGDVSRRVWQVRETYDTDSFFDHFVSNVRIENGCYSIYAPLNDPNVDYHQVGCEGVVHTKDNQIAICSSSPLPVVERGVAGVTTRVRFNTEHITNSRKLPWRIVYHSRGNWIERLAASFEIDGVCYSTFDVLPVVGEKWHIGCRGSVTFRGTHVRITSYE